MKRLAVVFVMVLAAVGYADYASEVMADSPEAYYRFETTNVLDSSDNGHHSTVISNVTFEAGAVGQAGTFSNAYAQIDLQLSPSNGSFSIEALVRYDSTSGTFVSQQNGTGVGRALLYRLTGGEVASFIGDKTSDSTGTVSTGEWHHLVMTVEDGPGGSNDTLRFYIDGQASGTNTVTAEAADGDWILGTHKTLTGPFVGALDEVAIYTNLLSQERITAHWDALTPVHYVSTTGASIWPYCSWAEAATNIQDAVNAAITGDTVLVTNGTYTSASEITVAKAITIESVNGREVTIVDGQNAHRCFHLGSSACTLSGFTVTHGYVAAAGGGGIYCGGTNPVISHCIISSNLAVWASGTSGSGGGIYRGTLNNCTLSGNEADGGGGSCESTLNNCILTGNKAGAGGGSYEGTLNNCTLSGNEAISGGGSYGGTLKNCIVYFNTATGDGDNWYEEIALLDMTWCCTTPDPDETGNNITNAPQFEDASSSNFHLQVSSPCVDAGNNAYAVGSTDLDGNPRILGVAVDIGAYEGGRYAIICSFGEHGSISPAGAVGVSPSQNVVFVISPDIYYHIDDVMTNGVSVGAVSNFTWGNVLADGTIHAEFAENLAAHDVPELWLAQYGWTNNFDAASLADPDGDGLATWQEYWLRNQISPTNGGVNAADIGLYTADSISDLDMGYMMIQTSNGWCRMSLQLEQCTNLVDGVWTNAGDAVNWQLEAPGGKAFFRVRGQ